MANYKRKTKDVHISPKLVSVLEKISNKSEIAKTLLKAKLSKEDLVDDPIDFLSISKEDPTKFTYLTPERIDKAGTEDPDELWASKSKIAAKPAVAIKKFLRNVNEKDLDLFTSLFKAAVSHKEFEFKIIIGDEIKKYYHQRSYHPEIPGTLHNSCMKHDHCSDFFDIYQKNPEVCKLLIMVDNRERLLGRALLWEATDLDTGSKLLVMDRIYAVDDSKNMHYFKEWADQNGYIYKKEQRWQNSLFFESHGSSKLYNIFVKIKRTPFVKYPYVDTFKFWDEKKSIICNYLPEDNGYVRTLMGNDGRTLGADMLGLDTLQQLYVNREHLIYLPYIDGRTHADHTIWSETMQMSIARSHSIFNEEVRDYIFNQDWDKYNDKIKFNVRKEQLRRINEQKAQKMVYAKRSRTMNSEYYTGNYSIEELFPQVAQIAQPEQPVVEQASTDNVLNDMYGTLFTSTKKSANAKRPGVKLPRPSATGGQTLRGFGTTTVFAEAARPATNTRITNDTVLDALLVDLQRNLDALNRPNGDNQI